MNCPACGARLDWVRWGENGIVVYACGARYTAEGVKEPCKALRPGVLAVTPLKEFSQ